MIFRHNALLAFTFCLALTGCGTQTTPDKQAQEGMVETKTIDFQGHRGCRGLLPENTVAGFLKAIDLGVTTLEMDVVITADGEVIVSHDPYFSPAICAGPDGVPLTEEAAEAHPIFSLTFAETQAYDCGSKQHPAFPQQRNFPATKPLLSAVIKAAEAHAKASGRPAPHYNIETKSTPEGDGTLHPDPGTFADLLAEAIVRGGIAERATVQSFDIRTLQHLHEKGSPLCMALLIENIDSPEENLSRLGFTPHIYSPYHKLVDKNLVNYCAAQGMKLIPWTVNETSDMERLLQMGVDGIISDYPDRFAAFYPKP